MEWKVTERHANGRMSKVLPNYCLWVNDEWVCFVRSYEEAEQIIEQGRMVSDE